MSLIVKNLKMPPNCLECPFSIDNECRALEVSKKQKSSLIWNKRPSWCPLMYYEENEEARTTKGGSKNGRG